MDDATTSRTQNGAERPARRVIQPDPNQRGSLAPAARGEPSAADDGQSLARPIERHTRPAPALAPIARTEAAEIVRPLMDRARAGSAGISPMSPRFLL